MRLLISPTGKAEWVHHLEITQSHADWVDATDLDDGQFLALILSRTKPAQVV